MKRKGNRRKRGTSKILRLGGKLYRLELVTRPKVSEVDGARRKKKARRRRR